MPSIVDFSHFQKAVNQDCVRMTGPCVCLFLVPEQFPPTFFDGRHTLQLHAGRVHNIDIARLCPDHHMAPMSVLSNAA